MVDEPKFMQLTFKQMVFLILLGAFLFGCGGGIVLAFAPKIIKFQKIKWTSEIRDIQNMIVTPDDFKPPPDPEPKGEIE